MLSKPDTVWIQPARYHLVDEDKRCWHPLKLVVLDDDAIGYKKIVGLYKGLGVILTLLIPAGAMVHLSSH